MTHKILETYAEFGYLEGLGIPIDDADSVIIYGEASLPDRVEVFPGSRLYCTPSVWVRDADDIYQEVHE